MITPRKTTNRQRGGKSRTDVGYKRPPSECQFGKGISGNPRGRPRKAMNDPEHSRLGVSGMLLKEAYAPIAIVENGVRTTKPAIQVVVRQQKLAALKGEPVAGRRLITTTRVTEKQNLEAALKKLAILADYKARWSCKIQQCLDEGDPIPDPVPHPEDIVIDTRTGQILLNGPVDDVEKAVWDQAECDQLEAEHLIKHFERETRDPERGYHASHAEIIVQREIQNLAQLYRQYPSWEMRRQPGFNLRTHRAVKDQRPSPPPGEGTSPRQRTRTKNNP